MVNEKAVSLDLAREAGLPTERFPQTDHEVALAEQALANELQRMSLDEQERAIFDVHGLSHVDIEEDPVIVEQALKDLEAEICKIEKKDAYEEAKFLNEMYVNSQEFRMMFLRCYNFDIKMAAQTLVYHFEIKKELFGNGEILAREIVQTDLTPYDKMILESGMYQLCPKRDACGRTIEIISCDGGQDAESPKDSLRAIFYMMMAILREEEVQKRGTVWICYSYTDSELELQFYQEYNRVEIAIPIKSAAGHYCYQKDSHDKYAVGFKMFSSKYDRNRMRIHKGTHEEINFKLATFGIPVEEIPIREDGTWSWRWHCEWVKALRTQEEKHTPIILSVIIPRKFDVLFGKNARSRDHTGNMRAHQLVELHYEDYEKTNKFQKTEIANQIISSIHESGGRFLKQDDKNTWVEVEDTIARQKIAHWCRHLRHKMSKSSFSSPPEQDHLTANAISVKRVTPCPSPIDPSHTGELPDGDNNTTVHPDKLVRTC